MDRPSSHPDAPPNRSGPTSERGGLHWPITFAAFAAMVASYYIARAGGMWAEDDGQAGGIRAASASPFLAPQSDGVYANGYGNAELSSALLALTGLDLATFLQWVHPLTATLLVFPAMALFRELTGSTRAAAFATLLLFIQPEFLFVILRGSHEQVLRGLLLVCLWLLARSFAAYHHPYHFAWHVVLFYLCAYALIAVNMLFGAAFVLAIATTVVGWWLWDQHRHSIGQISRGIAPRFRLVVASTSVLVFLTAFYVYPLSAHSLVAISELTRKLAMMLTTTDTGVDPYVIAVNGWVNPWLYVMVSLGDYLLIAVSAVAFLSRLVTLSSASPRPPTTNERLLLALYGAFAVQGIAAIIADRTGMLGGNLEHRSFPSFAIMATALVSLWLSDMRLINWQKVLTASIVGPLALLAVLKATNEPTLSRNWTFYTPTELNAMQWADAHHRESTIWLGMDSRLQRAWELQIGPSARGNDVDAYVPDALVRSFLVSDAERQRGVGVETLFALPNENRVFDNGAVQLFRYRPRTPFQE